MKRSIINLKNMTMALILALIYEIFMRLGHILLPSLFELSFVSHLTLVLFFLVNLIIILFIYLFYMEEKSDRRLELTVMILMVLYILQLILRLQILETILDYKIIRLSGNLTGFIKAILLFLVFLFYQKKIKPGEKLLAQAAVMVSIMFGIGIVKSMFSLIEFTRFVVTGIERTYSTVFNDSMFILFLMTHLAIINFLYRYYQLKLK